MRALHVSDTHGLLERLDSSAEIILHSGDFLPNRSRGIMPIEKSFQESWVHGNRKKLVDWIGDRRFVFTPGNHDYIDPCGQLREYGIDAHNLHTQLACGGYPLD